MGPEWQWLLVVCLPLLSVRDLKAIRKCGAAWKPELHLGGDRNPEISVERASHSKQKMLQLVLQRYYHHFSPSWLHLLRWPMVARPTVPYTPAMTAWPHSSGTQPGPAAWVSINPETWNKMETTHKHVEKCHPNGEKLQMIQQVLWLSGFLLSAGCHVVTQCMGTAFPPYKENKGFLQYTGAKQPRTVLYATKMPPCSLQQPFPSTHFKDQQ